MLILIACALAGAATAPATASAERPNFLHIMTDDQTIDSIRFMPETRRLLKRAGTTFSNYHATQPLCCPSRASFLTGEYPHNHGVLANLPPYGYGGMDFSNTLYTAMHDAGYRTGWIGKVLNAVGKQGLAPEPGFDEWLVPQAASQLDMYDFTVSDNGVLREIGDRYQTYFYGARARKFFAEPSQRPFLLTLSIFNPHWTICPGTESQRCPPIPAAEDLGRFGKLRFPFPEGITVTPSERVAANRWWRREAASMRSADRVIGTVLRDLRDSGELDNTYVIFQSDNGLDHGEHGVPFDKNVPWDRTVRVPLLIRGPGFDAGAERSDLTANVDVPATILDAAGVAPPLPPDGYSLLGPHRREALLLERLVGLQRSYRRPWRQIKTAAGWSYWRYPESGKRRLFNLNRDPAQAHNLIQRKPRRARRLQARLTAMIDCADPCP